MPILAKTERLADFAVDETALEAGDGGGRARGSFKMRELDAAMTQLVVHLNFRQRLFRAGADHTDRAPASPTAPAGLPRRGRQ